MIATGGKTTTDIITLDVTDTTARDEDIIERALSNVPNTRKQRRADKAAQRRQIKRVRRAIDKNLSHLPEPEIILSGDGYIDDL